MKANHTLSPFASFLLPRWVRLALLYAGLLLLGVPFAYPFIWMISSSFKPLREIFTFPPTLLPERWETDNYRIAFDYQPFAQQYFNSIYIAALVTLGVLTLSLLSGYAFARMRFRGRNILFLLLLSSLMMPAEVLIIPDFVLMDMLGLTNTHIPLIIIPVFGSAGVVGTFVMRQFFLGFPGELEDAARIDGISRLGIVWRIALPLSRSSLSTVAILTFLYSWNRYLEPLVFLSDTEKFTVPVALANYIEPYGTPLWGPQLAATTMSVVPILLFFIVAQQQVVASFASSGIKG